MPLVLHMKYKIFPQRGKKEVQKEKATEKNEASVRMKINESRKI